MAHPASHSSSAGPARTATRFLRLLGLAALLAGCAAPRTLDYQIPAMPEGASGWQDKPGWAFERFAVAAANPLATDAGVQVLKAGGNALDAAIAVQMVLTLVEPQSSGIGGGAFLMHWDGRELQAWDGRETAPAAAHERIFLQADGKPLPFAQAAASGLSVGVPGAVRMLEAAHREQGRLPWAQLFERAIRLAEQGFRISHRLHTQLKGETALSADPRARAYFYAAHGGPHPVGHLLKDPALAEVLRRIAREGSAALHHGPLADDIVARVRGHARPGTLQSSDLAGYAARPREPICTLWLARWRVCGFPPPSSGHLTVMQILGLLERSAPVAQPLREGRVAPEFLHAYTEAARLAYADRNQYIADPDFAAAPGGRWTSLLDDAYLSRRAALIGAQSMKQAQPGEPAGAASLVFAPQPEQPEHGTSHISIVDGEGRAVAMSTTIEAVFGSRIMSDGGTGLAGGFLLNNQLTDFSNLPADAQGRPIANRVQPGKRPRSSMSPTLVFDARDSALVMTLGSAFGAAIIHSTAKTLLATLGWGLDAQQAISLPNFGSFNGPTVLERGRFDEATLAALRERGHVVVQQEMTSGLQAIQRRGRGWFGGADPRREGVVMGQ